MEVGLTEKWLIVPNGQKARLPLESRLRRPQSLHPYLTELFNVQRQMNELELEDAERVLDWQHWAPPVTLTLMGFAFLAAFWHDELSAKLFIVVLFAVPSALFWLLFLRNKQRVQRDVHARMVEIVDGSPDKVWRNRFGMCFVSLAGKKIRVPAEYYDELQAATSVTLEYLPESLIALRIKPHRGLHLQ